MSPRNQDPNVSVDEEPEDEQPIGTGEDEESVSNGLALDPYADDVLFRPARVRVPRRLVIGIIVVLIAALLISMAVAYARGSWWYPPQPTPTSLPLPTALP